MKCLGSTNIIQWSLDKTWGFVSPWPPGVSPQLFLFEWWLLLLLKNSLPYPPQQLFLSTYSGLLGKHGEGVARAELALMQSEMEEWTGQTWRCKGQGRHKWGHRDTPLPRNCCYHTSWPSKEGEQGSCLRWIVLQAYFQSKGKADSLMFQASD